MMYNMMYDTNGVYETTVGDPGLMWTAMTKDWPTTVEPDDYCKHSFKTKDNHNPLQKNGLTRQWTDDKAIDLKSIS